MTKRYLKLVVIFAVDNVYKIINRGWVSVIKTFK